MAQSKQPSTDQSAPKTVGAIIREARERNGLSLRKLANMVGRERDYLWRLERDDFKRPNPNLLYDLALILNVHYPDLMAAVDQSAPDRLPELVPYLAYKYQLGAEGAQQLAEQLIDLLDEQDIRPKPDPTELES